MNSLSTVQIALLTIKKCALLKNLKTNVIPIYVDMKKEIFVDLKSRRNHNSVVEFWRNSPR